MSREILNELRQYLDCQGISARHFDCEHYKDCKRNNKNFTEAKEAYVGTEYVKHKLPRILFISLDSGSGDADPNKRTMEDLRKPESVRYNPLKLKRGGLDPFRWVPYQ